MSLAWLRVLLAALERHRGLGALSAALTVATALAVALVLPPQWAARCRLHARYPTLMQRLANPNSPIPLRYAATKSLEEKLHARESLVALVKQVGLLDQWDSSRTLPQRLKDAVRKRLSGEMAEEDKLEALVGTLDKRLTVDVDGNRVGISLLWPNAAMATRLVAAAQDMVISGRQQAELGTLRRQIAVLEGHRALALREVAEEVLRVEAVREEISKKHLDTTTLDNAKRALNNRQERAENLLEEIDYLRMETQVVLKSAPVRFVVLEPPTVPRRQSSPELLKVLVVAAVASAAVGLAAACIALLLGKRIVEASQLSVRVLAHLSRPRRAHAPPSRWAVLLALAVAVVTGAAAALTDGAPALTLAPVLVLAAGWSAWVLPLKWPLLAMIFGVITFDDPSDNAYVHLWRSPLHGAGKLLLGNVALFTGFELCLMALLAMQLLRVLLKKPKHPGLSPKVVRGAMVLSMGTIAWLMLMGLARGGDLRDAIWQARYLLVVPVLTLLAMQAFELPKDLPKLLVLLMASSGVKMVLGVSFVFLVARPMGESPPHTTGHNDTMLFVVTLMALVALVWERPSKATLLLLVLWSPVVLLALTLNDRRIANVDLGFSAIALMTLSPRNAVKRWLLRTTLSLAPLLAVYVAIGWNVRGGGFVFAPVQAVRAVVAPDEGSKDQESTEERNIENYDMVRTWKENMIIGQGFGHHFKEWRPVYDFNQSGQGLQGHNSILWAMWIGGLIGFTGIFLYLAVALFLLGRTYRQATAPFDRAALVVALSAIITYLNQAFGDMGTQSYQLGCFAALATTIVAQFSLQTGAWLEGAAPERSAAQPPLKPQPV